MSKTDPPFPVPLPSDLPPWRVARLTPPGRGAIGSTLLTGPNVFDLFARYFRTVSGRVLVFSETILTRPLFGRLMLGETRNGETTSEMNEEVVVHVLSRDRIEIHSHGGEFVCRAVSDLFEQAGAASFPASEIYYGKEDSKDEILALLPQARTEKAMELILRQRDGRLERTLTAMQAAALQGENIEPKRQRLRELAEYGYYLTHSYPVVLIGPTNAGKSSLVNALCGYYRAIVDEQAGTTRDTVQVETVLDGHLIRLTDTAGFRSAPGLLEEAGMRQAASLFREAKLILAVFDMTADEPSPIETFRNLVRARLEGEPDPFEEKKVIIVANKSDCPESDRHPFWRDIQNTETAEVIRTHTKSPDGTESLVTAILAALVPENIGPDEPIPLRSTDLI